MGKSPQEMVASMIRNLKDNTGKDLDEWIADARKSGLHKHGELVKFLKTDHGITHGYANLIAHKTLEHDAQSGGNVSDPVDQQYAGPKSGLRPIYDRLIDTVKSFGDDVEISPKKMYVSIRRNKQFAIIQPSTATRVDLGVNLKGREPSGILEASGSFNAMVTHRIRLEKTSAVDGEVVRWLKDAYDKG